MFWADSEFVGCIAAKQPAPNGHGCFDAMSAAVLHLQQGECASAIMIRLYVGGRLVQVMGNGKVPAAVAVLTEDCASSLSAERCRSPPVSASDA